MGCYLPGPTPLHQQSGPAGLSGCWLHCLDVGETPHSAAARSESMADHAEYPAFVQAARLPDVIGPSETSH